MCYRNGWDYDSRKDPSDRFERVCSLSLCLFQRELGRKLEIPVQEFVGKFRYKQNLNAKRKRHSQPCWLTRCALLTWQFGTIVRADRLSDLPLVLALDCAQSTLECRNSPCILFVKSWGLLIWPMVSISSRGSSNTFVRLMIHWTLIKAARGGYFSLWTVIRRRQHIFCRVRWFEIRRFCASGRNRMLHMLRGVLNYKLWKGILNSSDESMQEQALEI